MMSLFKRNVASCLARTFCAVALLGTLIGGSVTIAYAQWKVEGRYLKDPQGNILVPRGFNNNSIYSGQTHYIGEMAKANANIVREVVISDEPTRDGWMQDVVDSAGNRAASRPYTMIATDLENANANNMVVMLGCWDDTYKPFVVNGVDLFEQCVRFWENHVDDLVKPYENNLLIQIANESGDETDASSGEWFRKHLDAIYRLRVLKGIKAPLVICAPKGHDIEYFFTHINGDPNKYDCQALLEADPDRNIIFDWHLYDPTSNTRGGTPEAIRQWIDLSIQANICLVVGELGYTYENYPWSDTWPGDQSEWIAPWTRTNWQYLLEYANQNQIGYLSWVWSEGTRLNLTTVPADPTQRGLYGNWREYAIKTVDPQTGELLPWDGTTVRWGARVTVEDPNSIERTSVRTPYQNSYRLNSYNIVYGFNGGSDGWNISGDITSLSTTTEQSRDGSPALKLDLALPANGSFPAIERDGTGFNGGEYGSFWIYIPEDCPVVGIGVQANWQSCNGYPESIDAGLRRGQWNKVIFPVPLVAGSNVSLRIQLNKYDGTPAWSGPVYIDAVGKRFTPPLNVFGGGAPPAPQLESLNFNSPVSITWSNVPNETGYRIQRWNYGTGVWQQVATVGSNITTWTDSTATATNTPYWYRVLAVKGSTTSPASNEMGVIALLPNADAYVRDGSANQNTNYGTATTLISRTHGTAGNNHWSYLKFPLGAIDGNTIKSAKLKVYGKLSATGNTNVATGVFTVSNTTWTETGIKWSNKPALGASLGSFTVPNTTAAWFNTSISASTVQNARGAGLLALGLKNAANTTVQSVFNSRENGSNKPQLIVTFE